MRPDSRPIRLGLLILLFLGLGACDSLGPEDKGGPGSLTVSLLSPNGAEGSAVFELIGGMGLTGCGGGSTFSGGWKPAWCDTPMISSYCAGEAPSRRWR